MGCFYIESPGMRALFERLHCREFAEVVAASSIIRPGVAESGMMDEYIARHQGRGRSERRFARVQELLRRLLPETYGVMVYQEDVLLVAHEVAGMSYGEADVLRRAMSGKTRSGETMAAARERFVRGAMQRHGLTAEEAGEIWRQVASFAGYSFCKGHSAAFAVLSYQVAFLKAHWPAEFFAAVIDNGGGFYGAGAYVEEARRWGLRVLGPCVNAGDVHYRGATCGAQHLHASGWVRVGLGAVSEVSPATCERIVAERRRGGAFGSVADFLRRVRPAPHEARQLARAGALDTLVAREEALAADVRTRCRARQQIMLQLELAFRDATLWRDGEQLFGSEAAEQDNDGLGGGTPGRIEQENAAGRIDAGTKPGESDGKKRARPGAGAAMGIALENVGGRRCGGAGQERGEGDGINGKDYAAPGRRGEGGERWVSRNSKSGDGARTAAAGGSAGSELEARARLCRWEMQTLGFMVSGHPLDFVEIPDATVAARDIRRFAGRRVVMVGWAIAAKELAASNSGLPMKMLTLEDRTDTFEAVLFPKVYACFAPRTLSCGPYCVRGRVDMRLGSPTVNVENIEVLPLHLEQ
jgi:DNA polymerase III alpha subunit